MRIEPFALERYFARHEFSARHLLSSSDCEALGLDELVDMADSVKRRMWENLRLGYTESPGHPLLRRSIAASYDRVAPEQVLTLVPSEGIFLLMHALLAPGDHVVCVTPAYQSLYEVARSIGCPVSAWEPDEDLGWRFDPEQLETLLRPDTRLVVVNFPHNPTGFVPSVEEFTAVVERVERHGAWLLSDEMYRLLEIAPGSTLPAACDLSDRAVSLSGLSKSYGLPGLRVGWLACRDQDVLGRVAVLKDYTTICGAAPSEVLAIIALSERKPIVERQINTVRRNLDVLERFVAEHDHLFSLHPPLGGSICFPRWLGPGTTTELADRTVEEAGIMLLPSSVFGYGERHLRLGLGRESFPEALTLFGEYLTGGTARG